MSRKLTLFFAVGIFVLTALGLVIFLVKPSDHANTSFKSTSSVSQNSIKGIIPGADAQSCPVPTAPTGVQVAYPGCTTATACDLTQASCQWNTQTGASSYNVTVTQVESGVAVLNNQSEPSSTTKILFPIVQGKTYKCDVSVVSSCGSISAVSSDQLLCQADALIATPTATLVPVATIPPTQPPKPTLVPGGETQTFAIIGVVLIAIVGGFSLLIL